MRVYIPALHPDEFYSYVLQSMVTQSLAIFIVLEPQPAQVGSFLVSNFGPLQNEKLN